MSAAKDLWCVLHDLFKRLLIASFSPARYARRLSLFPRRSPAVAAAWAPFFDDMDAIIFLAPISCFDQVLAEDPTVNRLVRVPAAVQR